MKFNFNSDFNSDKGVLVFVCIRNNFDRPNVSIINSSDSPFNFWYVYITATKDIKGNKRAKILVAIKLTNQK